MVFINDCKSGFSNAEFHYRTVMRLVDLQGVQRIPGKGAPQGDAEKGRGRVQAVYENQQGPELNSGPLAAVGFYEGL
jgi:hypothetical protein